MSVEDRFQRRQVEANGIQYSLIDEGEGPPVLMLHGFPDTSSLWRHQIPALVDAGFRAVAPDLRGRGQTQAPPRVEDYALAGMVRDMGALLDALGIDRAHVVGHDFGAGLAWLMGYLAGRTGLSVRTLHHYGEICLLSPSGRTGSGHRLYSAGDASCDWSGYARCAPWGSRWRTSGVA